MKLLKALTIKWQSRDLNLGVLALSSLHLYAMLQLTPWMRTLGLDALLWLLKFPVHL